MDLRLELESLELSNLGYSHGWMLTSVGNM